MQLDFFYTLRFCETLLLVVESSGHGKGTLRSWINKVDREVGSWTLKGVSCLVADVLLVMSHKRSSIFSSCSSASVCERVKSHFHSRLLNITPSHFHHSTTTQPWRRLFQKDSSRATTSLLLSHQRSKGICQRLRDVCLLVPTGRQLDAPQPNC